MLTGSLSLGRLAGISINLHWSVLLIAVLLGSSLITPLGLLATGVAIVVFLGSILAHEMAHALVARRFGVGTLSVELWALGGVARLDRESPTPKAEGWIAVAGPLASLAVAVASFGTYTALTRAGVESTLVSVAGWLGLVNVVLAVFNMLPGAPLDGGRVLRAVRWWRHGDKHRATRDAGQAGTVLGWLIGALGAGLLLSGRPGIWLVVTGIFIALNARAEIAASRVAERLDHVKVGDLTWFGLAAAGSDMDADSMLWQRERLGNAGAVVVTDAAGRPGGLVLEDELWAVPTEQRPTVLLTQLMVPFARTAQADPDDSLADVLPRLDPTRPVITVWRDGRLLGVIPPATLRQRLTAATR
jgi:Zn-dependent protease